jgi:opacity protein-like surface antigen
MHVVVSTGQQIMSRSRLLLLSSATLLLSGAAQAQLASLSVSEGNSVLLPPVATVTQPSVSQSEAVDVRSGQVNLSLGKHFSTQIEGSAIGSREVLNIPTPGGVAATSLMLNGLYEVSNGSWHLKPYVGGGFGFVDANAHVLGTTDNEWQSAYQLHGGVQVGLAQGLVGNLEYRLTGGILPKGLSPTKFNLNSHGFSLGFKYQY